MNLAKGACIESLYRDLFQSEIFPRGPYRDLANRPLIEGSLEVKLPTIWTDEKQRWAESERREE